MGISLMGVVAMVERLWGSVIARDALRFFQEKLGPKYSDEQLAAIDANFVDGLARKADAERRSQMA